MNRRRRSLTEEDRRLWAEIAQTVRPLHGIRPEPPAVPPPADPPAPPSAGPPIAVAPQRRASPPPPPPLVGLERRTARALARGRLRPESSLDLHGLTQAEAHVRLLGFLRRGQATGQSLVLVITGRSSGGYGLGERGVLRRSVPLWLGLPELRAVVLGYEEAGTRQGGAGALYVRLRRRAP